MSDAPECQFAVSFMHLELRRELKEDYMRVGESKVGFKYRIANKIICSLESGHALEGGD